MTQRCGTLIAAAVFINFVHVTTMLKMDLAIEIV